MTRRSLRVTVAAVLAFLGTHTAAADDLANQSFKIVYDAQGIRSLKRTNDVHDTDYIQANGSLGRLLIRYRTTPNGDWREMRELILQPQSGQSSTITYLLGALQPTLASRSSPSAAVGVAGLRGLNDGQVPIVAAPGGRGRRERRWPRRRRIAECADLHLVGIPRRDAMGAVHISQSRRGLTRRSLLGRRKW